MPYRAVLLDVGETLVSPRQTFGEVYARVFAEHGLLREGPAFERALRAAWSEVEGSLVAGADRYGTHPGGERVYWRDFIRSTLRRLDGDPVPEDLADRVLEPLRDAFGRPEAWTVHPDVVPALRALRGGGIRLAVVSNWDSRLPRLLQSLGLASHLDAVATSALVGAEKPSPILFRKALSLLGVEPGQALHVGDRPDLDLAGARAAGIDGLLVDRHRRIDPRYGAIPDLSSLPRRAAGPSPTTG